MDAFHRGPGQMVVGFSFYGDINGDENKKKGKGWIYSMSASVSNLTI